MTQSIAEMTLAAQLEQAGIPFETEFRFAPPRRWRADFCVCGPFGPAPSNLLVEVDGGGFIAGRHTRGTGFENDAEKASAAAILGYRVIRATPRQVEDGRALGWIRQALGLDVPAPIQRRNGKPSSDPNRFDGVPRWQDWKAKMAEE